jgi:hypothetical protein
VIGDRPDTSQLITGVVRRALKGALLLSALLVLGLLVYSTLLRLS